MQLIGMKDQCNARQEKRDGAGSFHEKKRHLRGRRQRDAYGFENLEHRISVRAEVIEIKENHDQSQRDDSNGTLGKSDDPGGIRVARLYVILWHDLVSAINVR